jgi:hypothetical protein
LRDDAMTTKTIALASLLLLGLAACTDRDGPLENLGDEIEDAAEDAGDAIEDAADELDN